MGKKSEEVTRFTGVAPRQATDETAGYTNAVTGIPNVEVSIRHQPLMMNVGTSVSVCQVQIAVRPVTLALCLKSSNV